MRYSEPLHSLIDILAPAAPSKVALPINEAVYGSGQSPVADPTFSTSHCEEDREEILHASQEVWIFTFLLSSERDRPGQSSATSKQKDSKKMDLFDRKKIIQQADYSSILLTNKLCLGGITTLCETLWQNLKIHCLSTPGKSFLLFFRGRKEHSQSLTPGNQNYGFCCGHEAMLLASILRALTGGSTAGLFHQQNFVQ